MATLISKIFGKKNSPAPTQDSDELDISALKPLMQPKAPASTDPKDLSGGWTMQQITTVFPSAQRALFQKYADSSVRTVLFGIASNASIVYGRDSMIWYSLLTDYGLVGFVWLFSLYFVPVLFLWRAGRLDLSLIVFCTLYLMSFYQRPVIWLPAQMLIYFAGIYWLIAADNERSGRGKR